MRRYFFSFDYQAQSWDRSRRVVAKVEWHPGQLIPAVGFMRTLALSRAIAHWSLTTLREKLVKIGARMVRHGRYVTFQMAGVAVSGRMFGQILAPKTAVIWGMSANYRNATVEARRVITASLQFVTWIAA